MVVLLAFIAADAPNGRYDDTNIRARDPAKGYARLGAAAMLTVEWDVNSVSHDESSRYGGLRVTFTGSGFNPDDTTITVSWDTQKYKVPHWMGRPNLASFLLCPKNLDFVEKAEEFISADIQVQL